VDEERPVRSQRLDVLLRWEQAGGVWRVTRHTADGATVALMRCDAGEVVEEVSSPDTDFVAYLARRPSSES